MNTSVNKYDALENLIYQEGLRIERLISSPKKICCWLAEHLSDFESKAFKLSTASQCQCRTLTPLSIKLEVELVYNGPV